MGLHPSSNLIAVSGGKGGVGKSVFSANLACCLAIELRQPVLLVDLDKQSCGDLNVILGLRECKTIHDLMQFSGSIQPRSLPLLVSKFNQIPLFYLGASKGTAVSSSVSADNLIKKLMALSPHFKHIVIDIGNQIDDVQTKILSETTGLLLLSQPEILVVNQTLRLITDLYAANFPGESIQVVLNKVGDYGLSWQAVQQILKKPVLGKLPLDEATSQRALQQSVPFVVSHAQGSLARSYFDLARRLTSTVLPNLRKAQSQNRSNVSIPQSATSSAKVSTQMKMAVSESQNTRNAFKNVIHTELIKDMDLKKGLTDTKNDPQKEAELRRKTHAVISELVDRENSQLARLERNHLIKEILDEALGLGPLEDLLKDQGVTEIMVNGHSKIYLEKNGLLQLSPVTFTSNFHLRKVIERIVSPLGRQINESVPYVDARLQDGSRVNAVVEPLSIDGPCLTIRKFRKETIDPQTYVTEWKAATQNMLEFLRICVKNKLNVIISGGTGSGKTTLLNTLSGFIPSNERIITIEDAAELQLKQEHVVRLETRPANMEGTGAITIRDLVRNSLRMRPERIIVGECRDGAALDMLQAMGTGHDGSMTTVHANNPKEAISRLETLCLMAGMELPVKAIREQIANAVHLIVQIQRLSDGSRKIISVSEVQGLQGEVVTQQEVFKFVEKGFDKNRRIIGQFQATGLIPKFIESFEKRGLKIPRSLFSNEALTEKNTDSSLSKQNSKNQDPKNQVNKFGGQK